jgi:hypothetical protein
MPPWRPRRRPAPLGWLYFPRSVPRSLAPSRRRLEVPPPRVARWSTGRESGTFRAPLLSFAPPEAGARSQGCRWRSCGCKQARMTIIKRGRCPFRPAPSRSALSRAPPCRHQSRHGEAGAGLPLNQLEPCFPLYPTLLQLTDMPATPTEPPPPSVFQSRRPPPLATDAPLTGLLPAPSEPGISPLGPKGQSPPAPGRSRSAVRRNLAGPPPAGARGPHCEATTLSEDQIANRGFLCKHLKLLGTCVKMCSGIVFDLLQKLVKSV